MDINYLNIILSITLSFSSMNMLSKHLKISRFPMDWEKNGSYFYLLDLLYSKAETKQHVTLKYYKPKIEESVLIPPALKITH